MTTAREGVGVLTTDRCLVVRYWDAWLAEATGLPAEVACGRPLPELFPEIAERGFVPRLQRVASEGTVEVLAPAFHHYLIPCAPRRPSSHFARMQQHVTISPLRDAGSITGLVLTIEDVTARLERERELALQLSSEDEAIRLRAAQSLADEEVSPRVLVDVFADASWRVRQAAVSGVARQRGDELVPALLEALRERHQDASVLNATISALISSGHDVVPPLLELLDSPDPDLRIYVALALGHLHDARAVPALLEALQDEDANVRYHAIEALGRLRVRAAADALARVAEGRDFFLAFAALEALAEIGDATVAPRLIPLLEDEALLPAAIEALGRLGNEAVAVPLASLLNRSDAPAAAIASALAELYGRFQADLGEGELIADLARSAIGTAGVQRLVSSLRSATDRELASLALLLGWLDFPGVERLLVSLLAHPAVRPQAVEALIRRGGDATRALLRELDTLEGEACKAAIGALGRIGRREAVPALIRRLHDTPELAIVAAGALGSIGDRRAFEPLLGLLTHRDAVVRHAAVGALNSLGHPEMSRRIGALLDSESPSARESAARIAGYFGYLECLPALLRLCSDPEEIVRRAAVESLACYDDRRARDALVSALREETPAVRAAAARGLAHLSPDEARPRLREALEDADFWVRYYAVRAAATHRATAARPRLEELAASDPAIPVRIAAVQALGRIGAPESVAVLAGAAQHPDPELACAALDALGRMGDPGAREPLLAALGSGEVQRQIAAVEALGRHATPESFEAVARTARSSDDIGLARAAVAALAGMESAASVRALCELAADPRLRPACIAALAGTGEESLEWLGAGLRHPSEEVRAAVVEALARTKSRSASRLLASALADPARAVRLAAEQALARMDLRGAEGDLARPANPGDPPPARRPARDALPR